MKKILTIFVLFLAVIMLASCAKKQAEPVDLYDENGLSIIDHSEFEFVEPLEEPILETSGSVLTGAECFRCADSFVLAEVVEMQELKATYGYALPEGTEKEDSVSYYTLTTIKIIKSYGDNKFEENEVINIFDSRSSRELYGYIQLRVGGEYFLLLKDVRGSTVGPGRIPNMTDYASYMIFCASFMIIEKEGDAYNADVFMDFLLNNKTPEDYEYEGIKPPESRPYTLSEIEQAVLPYLDSMEGLEVYEVYNPGESEHS